MRIIEATREQRTRTQNRFLIDSEREREREKFFELKKKKKKGESGEDVLLLNNEIFLFFLICSIFLKF